MGKKIKIILLIFLAIITIVFLWGVNLYNQYNKKTEDVENHNYWDRISAFTLGMNLRFDKEASVYLGGFKKDDTSNECKEIMKNAYKDWQDSLAGKLNILFTDKRKDADIEISEVQCPGGILGHLERLLSKDKFSDCPGGFTYPGIKKRGLFVKVAVECRDRSDKILNPNFLSGLYLHETGHSLGLQYHSNYSKDAMNSMANSHLSKSDIRTVNYLYDNSTTIPPWFLIKFPYIILGSIVVIIAMVLLNKKYAGSNFSRR